MPLRNYIKGNLITCAPETTISEVARLMKSSDVGAVVVTEDGFPSGIVTDRDLALRCAADHFECANEHVRDFMTQSVETVTLDQGIQDVTRIMKSEEIRRVVVVDETGRALGLLSFGDMVSLLTRELVDLSATTEPQPINNEDLEKRAA